jgi:hypothetical protein
MDEIQVVRPIFKKRSNLVEGFTLERLLESNQVWVQSRNPILDPLAPALPGTGIVPEVQGQNR